MPDYDIIIVGGGPAGSTLAYCLKNSGLRIAVLDKAEFPRHKVCAGWVTPEVMRVLNIDLQDYAKGRVLQKINGFKISQIGQKQVQSLFPGEPVSYGILRYEFDHYLLSRCGAELILGQPFKSLQKNQQQNWVVNEKYTAKLVIGAGGHYCPVARAIDSKTPSELAVVAQEAEFKMSDSQKQNCHISEQIPELFFTPDLMGYGWVFRKGDYLNIGLGREDKSKLSGHVKDFCDYLRALGKIPHDIEAKYNGHAYLLYNHALRKMIDDEVLLVGDAAGLAYPQSGEGIRPAVESAMLAADTVRACQGDYALNNLQSYQRSMEQRFGQRMPAPDFTERLPIILKKFIARQLMKTRWFTKNIMTERWFLQSQQSSLPAIRE